MESLNLECIILWAQGEMPWYNMDNTIVIHNSAIQKTLEY